MGILGCGVEVDGEVVADVQESAVLGVGVCHVHLPVGQDGHVGRAAHQAVEREGLPSDDVCLIAIIVLRITKSYGS